MDKKQYMEEYRAKNRDKILKQRREHYAKNREYLLEQKRKNYNPQSSKDKRLRLFYDLSLDSFNEMLKEQDEKCACCGIHVDDLPKNNNQYAKKTLVVDHCHETGSVRKLLCNRCNTVIGLLEENFNTFEKIGKYLEYCAEVRAKRDSLSNS